MTYVLGIDAGGTKTVCQLADEHGTLVVGGARRRGEPAGLGRAARRKGAARRHGGRDRRSRDRARRRSVSGSPASTGPMIPRSSRGIMRRIGYKARIARRQRRARRARSGRAGRAGRGDHLRHRIDRVRAQRAERRRARRRLGPRARRRGQRLLDRPRGAARGAAGSRPPRPDDGADAVCCFEHFGVTEAQNLIHEVYQNKLRPAAIGALAQCVQAAFTRGRRRGDRDPARGGRRARGVRRQRGEASRSSDASRFAFILGGGIFRAVPLAARRAAARLPAAVPSEHGAPARSRAGGGRRVARACRKRAAARGFRCYKAD